MNAVGIKLRRMRWWDVENVLPIEGLLFHAEPWSPETFWSELAGVPHSRHYLVAEYGGVLAGYAGLMVSGYTSDIQTIAVAPEFHRMGIGRTLLRALLEEAQRRGCGETLLEVRTDNEGAQHLYAEFGFERIGVRRAYYQPGNVDALVMRRRPRT